MFLCVCDTYSACERTSASQDRPRHRGQVPELKSRRITAARRRVLTSTHMSHPVMVSRNSPDTGRMGLLRSNAYPIGRPDHSLAGHSRNSRNLRGSHQIKRGPHRSSTHTSRLECPRHVDDIACQPYQRGCLNSTLAAQLRMHDTHTAYFR